MTGNGSNAVLALAIASGASRQAAAQRAGVSERTLYRRLKDSEFVSELGRYREQIETETLRDLSLAATAAVRVLHNLAVSAADDGIKLRAASSILDHLRRLPVQPGDIDSQANLTEAEFARRLEIAFQAGKYGYILRGDGTLPPEIEARLPTDPRDRVRLMLLVDEKLRELRERGGDSQSGNDQRPDTTPNSPARSELSLQQNEDQQL